MANSEESTNIEELIFVMQYELETLQKTFNEKSIFPSLNSRAQKYLAIQKNTQRMLTGTRQRSAIFTAPESLQVFSEENLKILARRNETIRVINILMGFKNY